MPRKPSKKTLQSKKRWRKFNDLSGKRFGRLLVVVRDSSENHPRPYYKCVCDCGKEVVVCGTSLTRKKGSSRSCGCWRRDSKRLSYGESSRNELFNRYKHGAKIRGIPFDISKEDFLELTSQDCFYCGEEPSSLVGNSSRRYGVYICNGVDRVDSNLGYNLENCVPCCAICNLMKSDQSLQDFLEKVENIYNEQVSWEEK